MRTTQSWLITTLTNLHAGSGDNDYGIVDKHVQRDPVTDLPCVHASGIKGALREMLEVNFPLQNGQHTYEVAVDDIFGSHNPKGGKSDLKAGTHYFYQAQLLSLPIRSSQLLFYPATCPELIQDFLDNHSRWGLSLADTEEAFLESLIATEVTEGTSVYFGGDSSGLELDLSIVAKNSEARPGRELLKKYFGQARLAVLHVNDFNALAHDLPVIARNSLDNGISTNLWYEEVVPRQSVFYTFITLPGATAPATAAANGPSSTEDGETNTNQAVSELLNFEQAFEKLDFKVQVGGNASVGYGLTQWQKLK
jgi:CRISPR-associated protein Cmr4